VGGCKWQQVIFVAAALPRGKLGSDKRKTRLDGNQLDISSSQSAHTDLNLTERLQMKSSPRALP
jgi:hypothetical protein